MFIWPLYNKVSTCFYRPVEREPKLPMWTTKCLSHLWVKKQSLFGLFCGNFDETFRIQNLVEEDHLYHPYYHHLQNIPVCDLCISSLTFLKRFRNHIIQEEIFVRNMHHKVTLSARLNFWTPPSSFVFLSLSVSPGFFKRILINFFEFENST